MLWPIVLTDYRRIGKLGLKNTTPIIVRFRYCIGFPLIYRSLYFRYLKLA